MCGAAAPSDGPAMQDYYRCSDQRRKIFLRWVQRSSEVLRCVRPGCARSTARAEETSYGLKAIRALSDMYWVRVLVWHTRWASQTSCGIRTIQPARRQRRDT